jgi:hypothetical protein
MFRPTSVWQILSTALIRRLIVDRIRSLLEDRPGTKLHGAGDRLVEACRPIKMQLVGPVSVLGDGHEALEGTVQVPYPSGHGYPDKTDRDAC